MFTSNPHTQKKCFGHWGMINVYIVHEAIDVHHYNSVFIMVVWGIWWSNIIKYDGGRLEKLN